MYTYFIEFYFFKIKFNDKISNKIRFFEKFWHDINVTIKIFDNDDD